MTMDKPTIETFELAPAVALRSLHAFERPLQSTVREIPLLNAMPWIRTLGKPGQAVIAVRLLFQSALIRRTLIVCPKPLVVNWTRELKLWANDLPYEVIGGDVAARKVQWFASRCPVKLVNYELLTRDEEF